MAISYNRLWSLLKIRKIYKKELCEQAGISMGTISKMNNQESVSVGMLEKICRALDCKIEDIVEIEFKEGQDLTRSR